ncbi:hypothetical protein [Catellatospora sp. IY07-71]|uniref:mechanosensitive ion channel family protein n=1 Tax=Catellatospora sp. IY07-71 TaxID=2728827 RepID=UPI001BB304FC|nr:hypothetical protein [Catellatospora sp. IY07-71]
MDLGEVATDTLRSIALFLPKALAFVAILFVGWLVARGLRMLTDKGLERVRFDRLAERGGVAGLLARGGVDASDLVARLVYYAVLLFTLQLAFGIWGPNPVSDLINAVVAWLPQAFVAIVIVVVAAAIASWVKDLITSALGGLSYGRFLATTASVFIVGLGVIAALNQVGVATTVTTPILIAVLATMAGILIVGVGGGLVRPMQSRWEGWLDRAGQESGRVAEHARAYAAGQSDATQIMSAPQTGTVYPSQAATERPATAEPTAIIERPATAEPTAYPQEGEREPLVPGFDSDQTQPIPDQRPRR